MKIKNALPAARTARNTLRWLIPALACALAGVASAQTTAGDETLYSTPPAPGREAGPEADGGFFEIGSSNVMVSHLGYFCTNTTHPSGLNGVINNGLQTSHPVGIFSKPGSSFSSANLVAQVTVPAGMAANCYSNSYYWVRLNPPVMLLANTSYYLVGQSYSNDGDWWHDQYAPTWNSYFVGSQSSTTRSSTYGNGSATWPPTSETPANKNQIYGKPGMANLVVATDPAYVGVLNTTISISEGQTLTIVGFASGPATISYQWYTTASGVNTLLTGQTSSTLTIPNADTSNSGTYFLAASNPNGGSQSANVTVSVTAFPVGFPVAQPANTNVYVNYPVTISVNATGSPPLYYQWSVNGSPISGATASSYSLAAVTLANNGDIYSCLASNYYGGTAYTASTNETLTVLPNLALPQEILYSYNNTLGTNTYAGMQGGQFTVGSTNVLVTHLGYYANKGNITVSGSTSNCTLAYNHHVAIYNAAGTAVLGYVIVPAGVNPVSNGYMWQPLNPPLVLTNNTQYLLLAETFSTGDWWGNLETAAQLNLNPYFASACDAIYGGNGWGTTPYLGGQYSGQFYSAPNMAILALTNPAVYIQPAGIAQIGGTSASLTASIDGLPPVTLQWYQNGTPLPGQTNLTLSFAYLDPTNNGNYYAVVTNTSLTSVSATSTVASVTVYTSPVILGSSPQTYGNPMTLFAGASATFSLTSVTGYSPFSYQWFTNSVPDANGTSASYTVTNIQSGGPTTFACVVSNSAGFATNVWTISVVPQPTALYPAAVLHDNPIGYWRLNETPDNGTGNNGTLANDYWGGNDGVYTNTDLAQTGYSSGLATQYGYTPATDPAETAAQFGYYPSRPSTANYVANIQGVNFAAPTNTSGAFSIEAWAKGDAAQSHSAAGIVAKGAWAAEQFTLDIGGASYAYRFTTRIGGSGSPLYLPSTILPDGNWHHLVGVLNEPQSYASFYVDGVLAATLACSPSNGVLSTSVPVSIGARQDNGTTNYTQQFFGDINDVAIYNYPLSSTQIVTHYLAAGIAPRLTAQPFSSTNLDEGSTLTIPAQAFGSLPLSYQWYDTSSGLPGTPILGQTNPTLVISDISAASYNNHYVALTVTNIYGQVTSSGVFISVVTGAPGSVTVSPSSLTVFAGQPAVFTVSAQGTLPFYYQWSVNSTPIVGATNASYTNLPAVGGPYTIGCAVTNVETIGPPATATASLTAVAAPTDNYALKILGDQPLAYWRLDEPLYSGTAYDYVGNHNGIYISATNGLPGFSPSDPDTAAGFGMNGVTNDSLVQEFDQSSTGIPNIDFSQQGANAQFSLEAWVNAPPGQISGAGILAKGYGSGGEQFCLDIYANQFRFFVRNAATNAINDYSGIAPDGAWHHLVGVCDEPNSLLSLYVDGKLAATNALAPGEGIRPPSSLPGGGVVLTSIGSRLQNSSDNGTYLLQLSNAVVDEVAIYNYALSSNQVVAHYSAAAEPVTITVQPAPASLELYEGSSFTWSATAGGSPPLSYQWRQNSAALSGATAAALTLSSIASGNAGSYDLVVTNAGGALTSSVVTLTVLPAPTTPYDALILAGSPLHYWRLDETNGSIAYDYVGGLNGAYGADTTNGVPGVSDPPFYGFATNNFAVALDDSAATAGAGYVTAPALNLNTNTVTITAWVYPFADIISYDGVVFNRSGTYPAGLNYVAEATRLNMIGYTWNQGSEGTYGWPSGLVTPPGQWSFVALAIDPSQTVIYVGANGALLSATNAIANDAEAWNGTTLLGADTVSLPSRIFNGALDAVAVFDYTLSPAQIAQLYSTAATSPSVTLTIQWSGASLILTWPSGTLLQSPDLTGPWTTNSAPSPYTVTPSGAGMFYRVQVR